MSFIIVDIAAYQRRVGTIPPQKGAVEASFKIGDSVQTFAGTSFAAATNAAKKIARNHGVYTITLESIQPK